MSENVISGSDRLKGIVAYGGAVKVDRHAFSTLLGIEGNLVDMKIDPVSNSIDLYYKGDKEHFPPVYECQYAPTLLAEITVDESRRRCKTILIDRDEDRRYQHNMHCERSVLVDEFFFNALIQSVEAVLKPPVQTACAVNEEAVKLSFMLQEAKRVYEEHMQSQDRFKHFCESQHTLELQRLNLQNLHSSCGRNPSEVVNDQIKKACDIK